MDDSTFGFCLFLAMVFLSCLSAFAEEIGNYFRDKREAKRHKNADHEKIIKIFKKQYK